MKPDPNTSSILQALHTNPNPMPNSGRPITTQHSDLNPDPSSQPETVYIILEHTYEHDQDRKGRTKVQSKFAYSSLYEANQAAHKLLLSRGGSNLDRSANNADSHTECYSGEHMFMTGRNFEVWVEVKEMKMVYPKVPKTKGKKRSSTGPGEAAGQKKQKRSSDGAGVVDLTGA